MSFKYVYCLCSHYLFFILIIHGSRFWQFSQYTQKKVIYQLDRYLEAGRDSTSLKFTTYLIIIAIFRYCLSARINIDKVQIIEIVQNKNIKHKNLLQIY